MKAAPQDASEAGSRPSPADEGAAPLHLAAAPKDRSLLYAIGDVHGMADLMDALIACIESDAEEIGQPATLVFLGDLINRGPASRRVVERLLAGPRRPGDRWIVLRGNHEQSLLEGLQDSAAFQRFLAKGGVETLRSYGVPANRMSLESARAALPPDHLEFIARLPLTYRRAGWLFVHAGVEPGKPMEAQAPEKLLTIRKRFQSGAARLPFTVVHGHVPSNGAPVVARGRIGIDTGAVTTGVLTAVALEKKRKPRFLRVEAHRGKRVKAVRRKGP
ncbi:MAG: Diadenosine tetraphosphatase and related serine/threonine protein phosphatase [Hyphomicrobiales bacterium]|nr:Diadenosine tetraphosphatase and related serine/threonine protein phosphatase [Hyphomicrobiales bacterium]